jgi:hypothetical protein
MQEPTYPGGTAALPAAPSKKPIVAALVALLVGGAIATGVWWLTDNDVDVLPDPATRVIVADTPTTPSDGVMAKNEAGVAAAVGSPATRADSPTSSLSGVDGSASQYSGVKDYSKNGATGDYPTGQAPTGQGTAAKDEAATAAAIRGRVTPPGSE